MIYIGEYEELIPGRGYPSMRDSFNNGPYKGQGNVVYYLLHGTEHMIRMTSDKDVFTGEKIQMDCLGMNDGEYTWFNTLAHYVKKYNLRLPEEFEKKILSKRYGGAYAER